jgi:hypothetical protein
MNTYHKIQSIWKRNKANKYKTFLVNQWSTPELEYLADLGWVWQEKVDGMNVRVIWQTESETGNQVLGFRGKTDRAQMPPELIDALIDMFPMSDMRERFGDTPVCIYGEGFGGKIQKGHKYSEKQTFIPFDVKIGETWLLQEAVRGIAADFGLDVPAIRGRGTLREAAAKCERGFNSKWGDFEAEGLICRPPVELRDRRGGRIITKVKCRDFSG